MSRLFALLAALAAVALAGCGSSTSTVTAPTTAPSPTTARTIDAPFTFTVAGKTVDRFHRPRSGRSEQP